MISRLREFALLFSRGTKLRLVFAVLGSVGVALIDVVAVACVVPLMQVLTGAPTDTGALARIDALVGHPSRSTLAIILAVVIFGAFLLRALVTIAFRWWLMGMLMRQEVETSARMLRHFLSSPYELHLRHTTSEFMLKFNDAVVNSYRLVVLGAITFLTDLVTTLAIAVTLLVVAPTASLIAVVYFAAGAFLLARFIKPRALSAGQRIVQLAVNIYVASFEPLHGIKDVKLRHSEDYFVQEYRAARLESGAASRLSTFFTELPRHVLEVMFVSGVAIMTAVVFTSQPTASALATLSLFAVGGFRLLPSLSRMMGSLNGMRVGNDAMNVVLAESRAMRAEEQTQTLSRRTPLAYEEHLRLEHVGYRYPGGDADVLTDVDLDIPFGSSLAFVGGSGAGKTTAVDVLLGLLRPSSGCLRVDGHEVTDADVWAWQSNLAMVPQDVYLSAGSLKDNIAFGDDPTTVDEEALRRAIEHAQLSDLVADLPDGVDTLLGERGSRLSGGQKQRIGIARALYRSPRLLVLDEATSALDNETERRITDTIEGLRGHLTVVVVAHRLSTIRHCDQIAFLEGGRVSALGSFDHLRAVSPAFDHLAQLATLPDAAAQMPGTPTSPQR